MVDTSKFGKTKGTAVITKKDGTKIYVKDSKIVKEVSPEGKQRIRVRVAPLGTGARKKGVPAGEFVKDLPAVALQEKKRKIEAEQRKIRQQQEKAAREQAAKAARERKIRQTQSLRQILLTGEAPRIGEQATTILKAFIPARQKELKTTIERLDKSPYSSSVKKELRLLAASYDPKVQRQKTLPQVRVQGQLVPYRTQGEKKFYQKLNNVWERDKRLKGRFEDITKSLKLNVKDSDKWYTKALKGVGTAGVGLLFTGEFLANAVDISLLQGKAMFSGDVIRQANKRATVSTLKKVPKAVGESFDPRKPENWANIFLVIGGPKVIKGAFKKVVTRTSTYYVPSVRNVANVKKGFVTARKNVSAAKKIALSNIRKGVNVKFSNKLLKKISKWDKNYSKTLKSLNKIEKNPNILKLNDFNPLIETSNLMKIIGKEIDIFHATATKWTNLTTQKINLGDVLKPKTLVNKFTKNIRNKNKTLEIVDQGKLGMDRARFGENHFYFDVEVATSYAYNALTRTLLGKKLSGFLLKNFPSTKPFVSWMNKNFAWINANDKFTVIRSRVNISKFPKPLLERVKLASKGKLSSKQQASLRVEINKFIKDNPKEVFIGPRTAVGKDVFRKGKRGGEREVVKAVGGKIVKTNKMKFSQDPQTKLFFDVVNDFSQKSTIPLSKSIITRIKNLPTDIKVRFGRQDLAKFRSVKKVLSQSEKLKTTPPKNILQLTKKLISNIATTKISVKDILLTKKTSRSGFFRGEALEKAKKASKSTEKAKKTIVGKRKSVRVRKKGRVSSRLSVRPRVRVSTRPRVKPRTTTRPRSRVSKRPRERVSTRPRVKPRTTTRPRPRKPVRPRPRTPVRPRPRPTIPRPVYDGFIRKITPFRKKRVLNISDKKELNKIIKKSPAKYRPSLAALLLGITAYKVPKNITSIGVRPIILRKKK